MSDTDTATKSLPLISLADAEALVARLRQEASDKAIAAQQVRIDTVTETMMNLGFDDATMQRVIVALKPESASIVRINRNGQPVVRLANPDGSPKTNLTGEAAAIFALCDGKWTLTEIAEKMGFTPRSRVPYTPGYVRSWLTSGGRMDQKGYTVSFDSAGRVTCYPPSAA